MVGAHAEFLIHAFAVERFVFHGIDQRDVFADQLRHVFIARGNDHVHLLRGSLHRQCANHVVRLHLGDFQHLPAHQFHQFGQHIRLRAQIVGHGRPRGFVVFKQLVAEVFAFGIEHAGAEIVRLFGTQAAQHIQYAVYRIRGCAVGRGQVGHGVKRAIKIGRAIDKEQGFWGVGHENYKTSWRNKGIIRKKQPALPIYIRCRLLLNHIQTEIIQQNPTKNVSPAAKMPQNSTDKIWHIFKFN